MNNNPNYLTLGNELLELDPNEQQLIELYTQLKTNESRCIFLLALRDLEWLDDQFDMTCAGEYPYIPGRKNGSRLEKLNGAIREIWHSEKGNSSPASSSRAEFK